MTTSKSCPSGKALRLRLGQQYRSRISVKAEKTQYVSETPQARVERFKQEFTGEQSVDQVAKLASSVAAPVLTAASAVLAASAACGAFFAASRLPIEGTAGKVTQGVAAVAVGGVVSYGASKVQQRRESAAGAELWNVLATADDPTSLDAQATQSLRERFGSSSAALAGIKKAYFSYLSMGASPDTARSCATNKHNKARECLDAVGTFDKEGAPVRINVLIPPASVALAGDEHIKAREFLDAVGMPDEEAAPVHIDVGRSFFRQTLEYGDPKSQADGVKAFQKLVYVSSQLFGDLKAGYLCPWVARFDGVTPEQVSVAKRNGARMIMEGRINGEFDGKLPATAEALKTLRDIQQNVGLSDEGCEALVSELLAESTDSALKSAVEDMKARGSNPREHARAMKTVDELLQRSRAFAELKRTVEPEMIVPGIKALSVEGTSLEYGSRNDLVDLFRFYMDSKMKGAGDAVSAELDASLKELTKLLKLPEDRVEATRGTLVSKAYEKLLKDAVTSGRMDEAESPAAVLNHLLTRVGMPGEQALAMHEAFYKAKLRDCLADKRIDDEDVASLERTARLLCLTDDIVKGNDKVLKGDILRVSIRDALDLGEDKFDLEVAEEVKAQKNALRMSDEDALGLLEDMGRARLVQMINGARNKGHKLENAKALKKVVMFSNIVLAPLVAAVKGKSEDERKQDAMKEIAETLAKAKAEADKAPASDKESSDAEASGKDEDAKTRIQTQATSEEEAQVPETKPSSLAKAETARAEVETGKGDTAKTEQSAPGQKDIKVSDEDFSKQERLDIYKTYLTYCMTGEVVTLPMGGTIVLERDQSEFARLSQLGDLLDLNQMDVYLVHQGMAEEAFKMQAEALAPGGVLSDEGRAELKEMSQKMGIADESAEKIIRKVTNKRVIGNMEHLKGRGDLTLEKVLELVEQDADISAVLNASARMQLYQDHVSKQLGTGIGTVDVNRLLETLPAQLELDAKAAQKSATTLAKDKARPTLVQAFAAYRTKDNSLAVKYLNNLLACARVNPEAGSVVKWGSRKEIADVYGLFCAAQKDVGVRKEMGDLLQLDEEEQTDMQQAVDSGNFGAAASVASNDSQKKESFF